MTSDNFKREHKRRKLVDLEQEAEDLRKQLITPRSSLTGSTVNGSSDAHHALHTLSDAAASRIEGRLPPLNPYAKPTDAIGFSNQRDAYADLSSTNGANEWTTVSSPANVVSSSSKLADSIGFTLPDQSAPAAAMYAKYSLNGTSEAQDTPNTSSHTLNRTLEGLTVDATTIDMLFEE